MGFWGFVRYMWEFLVRESALEALIKCLDERRSVQINELLSQD